MSSALSSSNQRTFVSKLEFENFFRKIDDKREENQEQKCRRRQGSQLKLIVDKTSKCLCEFGKDILTKNSKFQFFDGKLARGIYECQNKDFEN